MLAYPGIGEPIDRSVRGRTPPADPVPYLAYHGIYGTPRSVDLPNPPAEADGLEQNGVGRFGDQVLPSLEGCPAAGSGQPDLKLSRMASEDDRVPDRKKVR